MAFAPMFLNACGGSLVAVLWVKLMLDAACMAANIFEVWQSGMRESWTRPYRFRGAHSARQYHDRGRLGTRFFRSGWSRGREGDVQSIGSAQGGTDLACNR